MEFLTQLGLALLLIGVAYLIYQQQRQHRETLDVLINLCEAVAEMYEITHGDRAAEKPEPQSKRTMFSPPRGK